MKKFLLALLLGTAAFSAMAQFKINGRIEGLRKADTLVLNIPLVYGYYTENNIAIPVDRTGKFSFTIPLTRQKFGSLTYHGKETAVLMSPGKALVLTLDTGGIFKTFAGTAGLENKLLYQAKLKEIAFFMHGNRQTNKYANLSNADIEEQVIKPWLEQRDAMIGKVNMAKLSPQNKRLINSEIKYYACAILNDFARGIMNTDTKQINELILSINAGNKADPDVFPAGPMYYYYAAAHMRYLETKALSQYGARDERSKPLFAQLYKMSLDSATTLVKQNGKAYINWVLFNANTNRQVAEQYLAQAIFNQYHDKNVVYADVLMRDMERYFPKSTYRPYLQKKIDELNALYLENKNNENIQVFKNYDKVRSIYEVVKTLKGKVVYLDIWGTWCGPCKDDLQYLPQLKSHFKDKDVAFVYLDMDDDEKDAAWKQFIRVNKMTGIHLRKNKVEVEAFWNELLPDKTKQRGYPTCFIFDKNGKLVQVNAKRPPDGAELYTELEKYL